MATDDELKRHMDVIAERMDDRFDRVLGAIGLLNEKVDRHRDEARDETAETQSMIRIS